MELAGYTIDKPLGSGGMATVFLGTQESFGRKVAIKILDSDKAEDEEQASRFIREAKLVAALAHPHIIPVYDVGQNHGQIYMSMEYLSGGDLAQWIKCGLVPEEILKIVAEISQALQFSHDKGVVHRDIKPDNIMFREDNSAVLTDFGIARAQTDNSHLTQENTVLGTPKYMSPEQLMGKRVDGRCDLYALGVVFFEMLTRRAPFEADDYSELSMKHLHEPVPQLPKTLQQYQPLLEKLMAKKADDRFQNGRAVYKAIEQLREQLKQPAPIKAAVATATVSAPKAASSPPLKPASAQVKRVETKGTGFHFNELSSGFGPFKKYTLQCDIVTPDAHTFGIQFSAVSTELLQWHDKRGGKASAITFHVTVNKMAFDKIKKSIDYICHTDGPYEFMQKLKVDVSLCDQFGELVEEYRVK